MSTVNTNNISTGETSKPTKWFRRHKIATAALLLVLLIGISGGAYWVYQANLPHNCRNTFNEKEWQQVADLLEKPIDHKLQGFKTRLEQECPSHTKDNDYKYISTVYYIGISDPESARESFKGLPASRGSFSYQLTNYTTLYLNEELDEQIKRLESFVEDIKPTSIIPGEDQ